MSEAVVVDTFRASSSVIDLFSDGDLLIRSGVPGQFIQITSDTLDRIVHARSRIKLNDMPPQDDSVYHCNAPVIQVNRPLEVVQNAFGASVELQSYRDRVQAMTAVTETTPQHLINDVSDSEAAPGAAQGAGPSSEAVHGQEYPRSVKCTPNGWQARFRLGNGEVVTYYYGSRSQARCGSCDDRIGTNGRTL